MLILPFSFANREGTDHDQLNKWLFLFFVPVSLTAIYSAAALFCRHSSFSIVFDENTHLITPINHVRYSLMVAFCIFIGIHLLRSNWLKSSFQKYLSLFFTLFLVVYLHFISVRSGLLGFYLVCFFYVIKAFMLLRIRKALVLSVLLAGLVLSASQIIPGFKHKLVVSKESVLAYASGEPIQSLSDNWRFRSIEAGLAIGTRDWLLGVGLGDLKNAMKVELEKVGKKGIKLLLPHNQFVFVFAFSGILGLCLFCFVLFKAVYIGSASGLPLFWHLNVIVLSSFLFDTTIETQVGLVFWVFFSLLLSRK
ncbi:MAG: O-antigen ligase family protein [Bacteroidota bacterium]